MNLSSHSAATAFAAIDSPPVPHTSGAALAGHDTSADAPFLALELPRLTVVARLMREGDAPLLEWHGGPDLRRFYETQWVAQSEGRVTAVIADLNSFPIGQSAIHWHGKPTHPHLPDIQSLRVFAAFRGLGIGTLLLQASENIVRERGFAQVSLSVSLANPKAQRLYERLGYVVTGEPYNDIWHYEDARGETVRKEEMVVDLVKTLAAAPQ